MIRKRKLWINLYQCLKVCLMETKCKKRRQMQIQIIRNQIIDINADKIIQMIIDDVVVVVADIIIADEAIIQIIIIQIIIREDMIRGAIIIQIITTIGLDQTIKM